MEGVEKAHRLHSRKLRTTLTLNRLLKVVGCRRDHCLSTCNEHCDVGEVSAAQENSRRRSNDGRKCGRARGGAVVKGFKTEAVLKQLRPETRCCGSVLWLANCVQLRVAVVVAPKFEFDANLLLTCLLRHPARWLAGITWLWWRLAVPVPEAGVDRKVDRLEGRGGEGGDDLQDGSGGRGRGGGGGGGGIALSRHCLTDTGETHMGG
mmetsp:Transcript_35540/g.98306  ORF Transcript_35540/g.98306 Transcript_35540/m.98306 type:complete len:207 (+) Transcript_35540:278-898(+)